MIYRISVPATSANMGSGFDCMGIALNMYNTFEVHSSSYPMHFEWVNNGYNICEKENLVLSSIIDTLKDYNISPPNCKIVMKECEIPISRGLGSSGAAIIAGVCIAHILAKLPIDKNLILKKACEIEGHPDNVVPGVFGGMTISNKKGNDFIFSKVDFPDDLSFLAVIPPYTMDTKKSREVLPKSYERETCVSGIAKAALLINSFSKKDYSLLRDALDDQIHQPYRLPLLKDWDKIFTLMRSTGSLGEFVSGSGSTLMGIYSKSSSINLDLFNSSLSKLESGFLSKLLDIDNEGLKIEMIH